MRSYITGLGEKKNACWEFALLQQVTPVPATTQRALVANQKASVTCLKYRKQEHYKSDCPKLENQFHVNRIWKVKARGNSNVVKDNADT
ncbi:hypothetical protein Tco_0786172 [Tanacetum coccineum]